MMIHRTIGRFERFWANDRGLSLFLVTLLVVGFVIYPLERERVFGDVVVSVFFSLVLVSGVAAISRRRRDRYAAAAVAMMSLAFRWAGHLAPGKAVFAIGTVFTALFLAIMVVVVLAQVFREGPITVHRIIGAVAVYLLLGTLWAQVYGLFALFVPDAFQTAAGVTVREPDLVYFSYVTLTTVGYGDITAVDPFARSMALLEALTGQLFPSILIARLVAMELTSRQGGGETGRF